MITRSRILVIGAYGDTGRWVISHLVKQPELQVVALGRRADRMEALCQSFGSAIEFVLCDIFDTEALRLHVRACEVVVNCAGPMHSVTDHVARVAITECRHYVDPGGGRNLFDMASHHVERTSNFDRSVVISSGWISGMSEIFPKHLLARAQAEWDEIRSFNSVYGDNSLWSSTATADMINFVRNDDNPMEQLGRRMKGKWRRKNFFSMWQTFNMPAPIGPVRAFSRYSHEFGSYADNLDFDTVAANVALISLRSLIELRLVRGSRTVDMLRTIKRLNRARLRDQAQFKIRSFVGGQITGVCNGKPVSLSGVALFKDHYQATGTAAAIMASLAARGTTAPGVNYAAQAANPSEFMLAVETAGAEVSYQYSR